MTFPDYYDPDRVGQRHVPDAAAAVEAGIAAGLTPARDDERRIVLLLVDAQVDFIHTDGALTVPGAVDDTRAAKYLRMMDPTYVAKVSAEASISKRGIPKPAKTISAANVPRRMNL